MSTLIHVQEILEAKSFNNVGNPSSAVPFIEVCPLHLFALDFFFTHSGFSMFCPKVIMMIIHRRVGFIGAISPFPESM